MKEYRFILLGFLIIVTVSLFIILKDISGLNEKNSTIVSDIEQMKHRITALEQDKTMQKITDLKAENAALRKQIEVLVAELNLANKEAASSKQQIIQDVKPAAKQAVTQETTVAAGTTVASGNKGFLKK